MKKVMKVLHKPANKNVHRDGDFGMQREHAPIQPKMNKKTQAKALQVASLASTNKSRDALYDRKHGAGRVPGRRWKMLRSSNENNVRDRTCSTDQDSVMSCATTISPKLQLHPSPTPRLPGRKDCIVVQPNSKKVSSPDTFYVPEEQDPLVQMMAREQKSVQALSVDQCNKISAAVAALDKNGSDLFARGEYQEAFLRFERALLLKRRSLQDHSLAWDKYEKGDGCIVPNTLGELSNEVSLDTEVKRPAPTPSRQEATNTGLSSLSSLSLLKSHPTYKATEKLAMARNQNQNEDTEVDEYKRTLIASVATSINNLTYLKQQNGQSSSEETLASYMQSLQMKLQVLGPDHLSVGKTLNNIGSVFYVQRKYEASLQAYLDAYCIMEASLGTENLDVATVASNIGDAYRCLGNSLDKALMYYRIALDIRWKLLPKDHPKVTRLMEQTAELELKEGDADTFLSPRRSLSFSDSDSGEGGEVEQTTCSELRSLKVEAQEDMEFIEELERSSARDIAEENEKICRELQDMRKASEKELADLIREIATKSDLWLEYSDTWSEAMAIHTGKYPESKNGLRLQHASAKETNEKLPVAMNDHTMDIADLLQDHSNRTIVVASSTKVSKGKKRNVDFKLDKSATENAVPCDNEKLSSITSNVPVRTPRLTREERQLALADVRARLAKIRSSRTESH